MPDFDSEQPHVMVSFITDPGDPKAVEMQMGVFNVPDVGPVHNLISMFVNYSKDFPKIIGGVISDGRKEVSTANDRTPEESRIINPGVQRQDGDRRAGFFRVGGAGAVSPAPIAHDAAPILDIITGRPLGGN